METETRRAVAPVVGTLLLVAIVVLLAGTVVLSFDAVVDERSLSEPQFSGVQITDVEADDGSIEVPALQQDDQCGSYHLVITIEHLGGDGFTSDELEYRIDAVGEETTVSGTFTSNDANPGATARAGDEIVIALDGDTNVDDCGVEGEFDESYIGLVFAGEPAWSPQQPPDAEGLGSLHNTFFEPDTENLQAVRVTIIQDSTRTIIIDDTTTDIRDRS